MGLRMVRDKEIIEETSTVFGMVHPAGSNYDVSFDLIK